MKFQIILLFPLLSTLFACNNSKIEYLESEISALKRERDSISVVMKSELDQNPRELGELRSHLLVDSLEESFYKKSIKRLDVIRLYLTREYSDLLIQGSFDGENVELFYVISNYSEYTYNGVNPEDYTFEKYKVEISVKEWMKLYGYFMAFKHEDFSTDPGKYLGNPISCTYKLDIYSTSKNEVSHNWHIVKSNITPSNREQLPKIKFYELALFLVNLCKLEEWKNDTLFEFK